MSRQSTDSAVRRTALVLSPEAPYPVAGGGPLRTASIVEYLSQHHDVDVITFRQPDADPPAFPDGIRAHVIDLPHHAKHPVVRATRNIGRAWRGVPPLVDRFAGFEAEVTQAINGRRYQVGLIEHFWCAPYAAVLRPHCDRLVLDLHNVESVLLRRCAAVERTPVRTLLRRFADTCLSMEQRWIPQFDTVLVTSEADRSLAGSNAVVYPNAIPWVDRPVAPKRHDIVFSGNLEYHPNQTAVRWFAERVWPALRSRHPSLRWRLVGKNEHAVGRFIAGDDRIDCTGPVEDAVTQLASAALAVVPVRSGSGTRTKIIEAWAACIPVVSTTIGAEGLPCTPGEHLLIADTPAEFAAAVESVLDSASLSHRLGTAGRLLYEERLTWPAAWKCLDAVQL